MQWISKETPIFLYNCEPSPHCTSISPWDIALAFGLKLTSQTFSWILFLLTISCCHELHCRSFFLANLRLNGGKTDQSSDSDITRELHGIFKAESDGTWEIKPDGEPSTMNLLRRLVAFAFFTRAANEREDHCNLFSSVSKDYPPAPQTF